jgi:hypothetical protein
MKFCQRHWDMMRAAVEARGMTPLVANGGKAAVENLVDELERGPSTDNFDPLMAMHWNIATNLLQKLGQSAGYLMFGGPETPEDPIDVERLDSPAMKAKYRGKTWPRCPICYANIAHEFTCREARCTLAREDGWDVCIEFSADAVKQQFDEMMRSIGGEA